MNVVIDHREPEPYRLLFGEGDHVTVAQLPVGDFQIDDQWIFERKTIHDLCISLVDGRLFRQALALVKTRFHTVFILEGSMRDMAGCNVKRESIQGALVTLAVFFGLPVLRSLDPEETVRLMRYTVRQGDRMVKGCVHRFGYRPKGLQARRLFVLQGLPGIGKQRAQALLDRFGCIEAVMRASDDELAEVDGIGYSTARTIRNLVAD